MDKRRIFSIVLMLCISELIHSQTLIRGISNWPDEEIRAYRISDFLSGNEIEVGRSKIDTSNIFEFTISNSSIEKIVLKGDRFFTWLFIQPKTRYFIELPYPEEKVGSLEQEKEIEMLFFRLDTNDINYKILGFEAWMDETIADIYQLKEVHPEQFISRVRSFKKETAMVYNHIEEPFFFDYVKYSVGMTIDNFNIIGGPSKQDKFDFYLHQDSLPYNNPKFFEYAESFYEKYLYQLEKETKEKVVSAFEAASIEKITEALIEDPYIQTKRCAEFVLLLMCKEALDQGYLDKSLLHEILQDLVQYASIQEHQFMAKELIKRFQQMQIGMKAPDFQLSEKDHFYQYKGKWIYLHAFDLSVNQCIIEIPALKKLQAKYGQTVQFITIYPNQPKYTESEKRSLNTITWDKYALNESDELWKILQITSKPMYLLFDPQLVLQASPALSPTPNGKYETIERFFLSLNR